MTEMTSEGFLCFFYFVLSQILISLFKQISGLYGQNNETIVLSISCNFIHLYFNPYGMNKVY